MISETGSPEASDQIANLAVGVVAGGVEERRGELDFERFGALDEIDEWRHCVGQPFGERVRESRQPPARARPGTR